MHSRLPLIAAGAFADGCDWILGDEGPRRLLREALANPTRGRTLLVVAHRLETIRHADRIVCIDDGRIVESGTHDELLGAGGRYREFWSTRERSAGWRLQNT